MSALTPRCRFGHAHTWIGLNDGEVLMCGVCDRVVLATDTEWIDLGRCAPAVVDRGGALLYLAALAAWAGCPS